MDQKKECSCDKSYWPQQAWAHAGCEKETAKPISVDGRKTIHGFDRKAYQKAYMKAYRRRQSLMLQTAKALLEHVAEPWPRG